MTLKSKTDQSVQEIQSYLLIIFVHRLCTQADQHDSKENDFPEVRDHFENQTHVKDFSSKD